MRASGTKRISTPAGETACTNPDLRSAGNSPRPPGLLPQGPLAKAMGHAANHWQALIPLIRAVRWWVSSAGRLHIKP